MMSVMCQDAPGSPPTFRIIWEVEPGNERIVDVYLCVSVCVGGIMCTCVCDTQLLQYAHTHMQIALYSPQPPPSLPPAHKVPYAEVVTCIIIHVHLFVYGRVLYKVYICAILPIQYITCTCILIH